MNIGQWLIALYFKRVCLTNQFIEMINDTERVSFENAIENRQIQNKNINRIYFKA